MGVLDEIIAGKRDEVAALAPRRTALVDAAESAPPARGFAAALRRPDRRLAVIAEVKRRSPSKGDLAPDLDPAATARAYATGGAAALSVLTDERWFGGSLADLAAARAACPLPVLRKDFVIDELQLFEARAAGADAVLLIVAGLPDDGQLRALHDTAFDLGLDVLTEAHDGDEVERALTAGARVVGVNSRDLQTFGEDLSVAERAAKAMPDAVVRVAESAIRSAVDAQRMAAAGFDAVLVGEALVRAADPAALVGEMAAAEVTPCS
jgi:indole-3-glycerol phosphate synthase